MNRPKVFVAAVAASPVLSFQALTVQGLGSLGTNITTNLSGMARSARMLGFVTGFPLLVTGVLDFLNLNPEPYTTLRDVIAKRAIGTVLPLVVATIFSFSATISGDNESSAGLEDLGL